jgi:hypothetical protein
MFAHIEFTSNVYGNQIVAFDSILRVFSSQEKSSSRYIVYVVLKENPTEKCPISLQDSLQNANEIVDDLFKQIARFHSE